MSKLRLSQNSKLVQEHQQDKDRTHELNQEEIDAKEATLQGSPIGKLILQNLLWHIPSQEQTSKQACHWKENLSGDEIKPIEKRLAQPGKLVGSSQ